MEVPHKKGALFCHRGTCRCFTGSPVRLCKTSVITVMPTNVVITQDLEMGE